MEPAHLVIILVSHVSMLLLRAATLVPPIEPLQSMSANVQLASMTTE